MLTNVGYLVWRQVISWRDGEATSGEPRVMLWAWEHPEDLSFLDCADSGVAFLAETIVLDGDRLRVRPRLQPLRVPEACVVVPVVRLEAGHGVPAMKLIPMIVGRIERLVSHPGITAVQIDFDVLVSQRAFYRRLLGLLRKRLPARVRLTMTALASWCIYDTWIRGLPVDEAVPMVFRMGPDGERVRRYLGSGRDFRLDVCRSNIGVATDEELPPLARDRTVYVFHPRSWSPEAVGKILKDIEATSSP